MCIVKHLGHHVVEIEDGVRNEIQRSKEIWRDLDSLENQIAQTLKVVSERQIQFDSEVDQTKSEVSALFDQLELQLQESRAKTLQQLENLIAKKFGELSIQNESLERNQKTLQQTRFQWESDTKKKLLSNAFRESSSAVLMLGNMRKPENVYLLEKPISFAVYAVNIPDFAKIVLELVGHVSSFRSILTLVEDSDQKEESLLPSGTS
jgi:hypothetical protein